jgi:hypothetical protein
MAIAHTEKFYFAQEIFFRWEKCAKMSGRCKSQRIYLPISTIARSFAQEIKFLQLQSQNFTLWAIADQCQTKTFFKNNFPTYPPELFWDMKAQPQLTGYFLLGLIGNEQIQAR